METVIETFWRVEWPTDDGYGSLDFDRKADALAEWESRDGSVLFLMPGYQFVCRT